MTMKDKNLAIAYAIKKRMSRGGMVPKEDMAREHDPLPSPYGSSASSEMMHPNREPSGLKKTKDFPQERLGRMAQEHEEIAEPAQPKRHVMPAKENLPQNMAHGGMAKDPNVIVMNIRKKMAHGGMASADDDDFLTAEMGPEEMESIEHEIMPDDQEAMEDEPHVTHKKRLEAIMKGLHHKHYGK